ncbi:hypothetical protein ACJU5N_12165 [Enterobacter hormaechei subsp. xiangfangensis]|uniref:hypothetical protein n=1 Tax=Enterobacter hormaechei TaxID=158836 RepID=UPI003DA32E36
MDVFTSIYFPDSDFIDLEANASPRSLFNTTGAESKFQHRRRCYRRRGGGIIEPITGVNPSIFVSLISLYLRLFSLAIISHLNK